MSEKGKIALVIPCYREHNRLPDFFNRLLPAIRDSGLDIQVRIVDDGSGRSEQQFLLDYLAPLQESYTFLQAPLLHDRHHGKGYCVYEGWRRAAEKTDFLAFIDADGSISPEEMLRLVQQAVQTPDPRLLLISSRQPGGSNTIRRRFLRHILNRIFTHTVNRLFDLSVADSQCGCKIISADVFREIQSRLQEKGFLFDVELLALAQQDGIPIHEVSITWHHRHSNRIHVIKDGVIMLAGLFRLRRRLAR